MGFRQNFRRVLNWRETVSQNHESYWKTIAGSKEKEETMRLVLKSDWTSSIILVKKRKPKKCILFWKDINLCGRCLPPIIIRDSSYYCICVAWELNKSDFDEWVEPTPSHLCVENGCNFLPLNSEEIHFFAPKDCRCNLLSTQIILPLEKTFLQLAWVNLGLINWNIFY